MEGKMPQSHGLRIGDPLGRIGTDEQFQHRVTLPEHPQIVILSRTMELPIQLKAQLVHIEVLRLSIVRRNDGDMMLMVQKHSYISCTELGNRLLSVWGMKQAATKESM